MRAFKTPRRLVLRSRQLSALMCMLLCTGVVPCANSTEFTGRIVSDIYYWTEGDNTHLRPYESFLGDLKLWQSGFARALSLHSNLRWTTDLRDKQALDPQLYLYETSLRLRGIPRSTTSIIGRQFVYSPLGSALMDGISLQSSPSSAVRIDAAGGSFVAFSRPTTMQSFADAGYLTARLSARPAGNARAGLSWLYSRDADLVSRHQIGADIDREFTKTVSLYGRGGFDLLASSVVEGLARLTISSRPWYWSGEYAWRRPTFARQSLFGIIDAEASQTARGEIRRVVWKTISLSGQGLVSLRDGDNSWRVSIGVVAPNFSLYWRYQTGYGGDRSGISGYASMPVNRQFELYASANMFRYQVQTDLTGRSDSYSAQTGIRWRPGHGFEIRSEAQYLRNAVQSSSGRLFFRLAKDFSLGAERRLR